MCCLPVELPSSQPGEKTLSSVLEKARNNAQETTKNGSKNTQKIFEKTAKSSQASVLPFYVLDVLVTANIQKTGFLTVREILDEIHRRVRVVYAPVQVHRIINNMSMYSTTLRVEAKQVHAGRSRAKAFSIQFKND